MFHCARCRRLVVICTRCDRGQRYCSADCAQVQRRRSVGEAGRRYQQTPLGARHNAARQKRWRLRSANTVTHHTSTTHKHLREETPGETVHQEACDATSNRKPALSNRVPITVSAREVDPRCNFCGRACGDYTRLGTLSAERWHGWRASRRL